jgi:hypothetical protein
MRIVIETACRDKNCKATYGIKVASETPRMAKVSGLTIRILNREERTEMIKKTGEVALMAGAEEIIAVNNTVETEPAVEKGAVTVGAPRMQEKVNLIIHEWLTDMWLLTTGEQLDADVISDRKHNGRPLAILCDGQMRLMESKPCTLNALRTVGIEMS